MTINACGGWQKLGDELTIETKSGAGQGSSTEINRCGQPFSLNKQFYAAWAKRGRRWLEASLPRTPYSSFPPRLRPIATSKPLSAGINIAAIAKP